MIKKILKIFLLTFLNLLAVEALLQTVNLAYPLVQPARLKDTYQSHWLAGFEWHNGETRLYNYKQTSDAKTNGHPFRVNHWGFRGKEFLPRKEEDFDTYRILVIGDSLTVGQGVAEEDRFSDVLERKLKERYPDTKLEVVNLGVQGFETLQEYKILKGLWDTVQPDLTIIGFWINDPNISYRYYDPYKIPASGSLRPLLDKSLLARLFLEPAYDRIYRSMKHIPTYQEEEDKAYNRDSRDWKIFELSVKGIADQVKGSGTKPIAIFLPDVTAAKKQNKYAPVKETFLMNDFVWVENQGKYIPVSRFDFHPGEKTHASYADALFGKITELDLIGKWAKRRSS